MLQGQSLCAVAASRVEYCRGQRALCARYYQTQQEERIQLQESRVEPRAWRWGCHPTARRGPDPKQVWPCRQSVAGLLGCQYGLKKTGSTVARAKAARGE